MSHSSRAPRGATTRPPTGYDILRVGGRSIPVRVHLQDLTHPGTTALTRPDGTLVSFTTRLSALVSLSTAADHHLGGGQRGVTRRTTQ
jgi:hypothetical protein